MNTPTGMAGTGTMQMSEEMRRCISDCLNCHSICVQTVEHCLSMGGKHADPQHIKLLLDCAEICQTSANFMLRNSRYHPRTCGVCAEVCEACAQSCEQLDPNDQIMSACAQMCRQCAESCGRMAQMQM